MPKPKMPSYTVTEADDGEWEAAAAVGGEIYSARFSAPTSEEAEFSARAYAALVNAAFGQPPGGGTP